VSELVQGYFANFIRTGNPNGPDLPTWPAYGSEDAFQVMRLEVSTRAEPETTRPRYLFLDPFYVTKP
jgi:para-nitrobenzyl esterase